MIETADIMRTIYLTLAATFAGAIFKIIVNQKKNDYIQQQTLNHVEKLNENDNKQTEVLNALVTDVRVLQSEVKDVKDDIRGSS